MIRLSYESPSVSEANDFYESVHPWLLESGKFLNILFLILSSFSPHPLSPNTNVEFNYNVKLNYINSKLGLNFVKNAENGSMACINSKNPELYMSLQSARYMHVEDTTKTFLWRIQTHAYFK